MNTYQIKDAEFYSIAEKSSYEILRVADETLSPFYGELGISGNSSKVNFVLDSLILGVFWREYNRYLSLTFLHQKKAILTALYSLRSISNSTKSFFDSIRGVLAAKTIVSELEDAYPFNIENAEKLTVFMDATTEFKEESIRVKSLLEQLHHISEDSAAKLLNNINTLTDYFINICRSNLSRYTEYVDRFLSDHKEKYFYKENYFFTGRSETEYFLNIVGATLLNMDLKEAFAKTKRKVVILPCCMAMQSTCKSVAHEHGYKCTKCNKKCNVYKLVDSLDYEVAECILIKHSSNFSKQLEPWADQSETGLVGVACILNLLKGGYEMKKLDIPSQCVFLNYSGCKKHWMIDVPTDLNQNQLLNILSN